MPRMPLPCWGRSVSHVPHCIVEVRGQHDDRDEADSAEGAEVGGNEGNSAPQCCGDQRQARHVVLPRTRKNAGAGINDGYTGN